MDNKLEYIQGDLVMTNGVPLGTAKDVVYRVTSSDPTKTLELDDGTVTKGVVRLENIEGAEFGEKGYLLGDCCAWVKDIAPSDSYDVCQDDFYLGDISYVHDLQHLLFGLGINHEMEV